MNIHEYQAKELLKRYGVPVPLGKVASTPQEAKAAAIELAGHHLGEACRVARNAAGHGDHGRRHDQQQGQQSAA